MLVTLLIGFQLIAFLFIAIFARTNSTSSYTSTLNPLFNNCLFLLLAFTLMYNPFRKLSLFSLGSILLVLAVTVQTYFLFGTFWDSCFNGFNSTFTIDLALITRSLYASLLVLLTALDFIGVFCYWQVYLIMAPIMTIGSSLCSALLVRGLKIFDGGGGLLLFFYSGICSLIIWVVLIRGNIDPKKLVVKQSYINQTLGLIGVILAFINWPKFNAAGALVSYYNVSTTSVSLTNLQGAAISNTYLALSSCILLAFLFASKEGNQNKMRYPIFIDCFVNGGISIASFQDIALDPTACIVIASFTTAITLLISKRFLKGSESIEESPFKMFMVYYGRIFYRLVIPFLGIIICSIVVAARSNRTPSLLTDNYSKIAGLEIVGLIIVLIFALIFGAITAYCMKLFISSKEGAIKTIQQQKQVLTALKKHYSIHHLQIQDQSYFSDLVQQSYPLYYDMFDKIGEYGEQKMGKNDLLQYSSRLKEAFLGDNPLKIIQGQKAAETNPVKPQNRISMSNNFTKNNHGQSKSMQVSAMKKPIQQKSKYNGQAKPLTNLQLDSNQNDIAQQIKKRQTQQEEDKESQPYSEGMVSFGSEMIRSKSNITFNKRSKIAFEPKNRQEIDNSHININLTSSRAVQDNHLNVPK